MLCTDWTVNRPETQSVLQHLFKLIEVVHATSLVGKL